MFLPRSFSSSGSTVGTTKQRAERRKVFMSQLNFKLPATLVFGALACFILLKGEVDPDRAPQFGLVAEQVEKVDPELVVHDEAGKPFTVRYEAVNAMLLNEFLKARRQIDQQQKQIETLTAESEWAD
jgi:hypothetical protein